MSFSGAGGLILEIREEKVEADSLRVAFAPCVGLQDV